MPGGRSIAGEGGIRLGGGDGGVHEHLGHSRSGEAGSRFSDLDSVIQCQKVAIKPGSTLVQLIAYSVIDNTSNSGRVSAGRRTIFNQHRVGRETHRNYAGSKGGGEDVRVTSVEEHPTKENHGSGATTAVAC